MPFREEVLGQASRPAEQQPQGVPQAPIDMGEVVPAIVQNGAQRSRAGMRVLATAGAVRPGEDSVAVAAAMRGRHRFRQGVAWVGQARGGYGHRASWQF